MHRYIPRFLLFILPLTFTYAQSNVAVLEFQGSGVSKIDAINITSRFSVYVFETGKVQLVERDLLERILAEQNFQVTGCVAQECAVEIGQLVGVQQVIAGTVSLSFGVYTLTVRLVDVETGKIITQIIKDHTGSAQDFLLKSVKEAAYEIVATNYPATLADNEPIQPEPQIDPQTTPQSVAEQEETPPVGLSDPISNPSEAPMIKSPQYLPRRVVLGSYSVTDDIGFGIEASIMGRGETDILGFTLKSSIGLGALSRTNGDKGMGYSYDFEQIIYLGLGINTNVTNYPKLGMIRTGLGFGISNTEWEESGEFWESTSSFEIVYWAGYALPLKIAGINLVFDSHYVITDFLLESFMVSTGFAF